MVFALPKFGLKVVSARMRNIAKISSKTKAK